MNLPQFTDEVKFWGLAILLLLASIIIIGEATGLVDGFINFIQ